MKREKVMVIEDEPDILEMIDYNLIREGYETCSALDGESGICLIAAEKPDIVLLDLMLPGINGIEVCRRVKGDPRTEHIPVIMVTAKGEEKDIVNGLGIGADDYVSKPFSPKELIARIKAVLRRTQIRREKHTSNEIIVVDGVVIDTGRHEISVNDNPVFFTATEFKILHFLASHPGRVFTRESLLSTVLGEDAIVIDRNIDVHIQAVRKKLGSCRSLVETIRGVGYRFKDKNV